MSLRQLDKDAVYVLKSLSQTKNKTISYQYATLFSSHDSAVGNFDSKLEFQVLHLTQSISRDYM